ncbi:MAG: LSU ribosomal protein L19p, partial [uncultured Acidimicrobiales bacterium]
EPHRSRRSRQPSRRHPPIRPGRHAQGPRAGGGGEPGAGAGLPGGRHPPPGLGRARDLHRPQDQLRRRRGAHLPGPLADHRQDRRRPAGRRAAGQALLPARPDREEGQDQGEAHRQV